MIKIELVKSQVKKMGGKKVTVKYYSLHLFITFLINSWFSSVETYIYPLQVSHTRTNERKKIFSSVIDLVDQNLNWSYENSSFNLLLGAIDSFKNKLNKETKLKDQRELL